MTVVLDQRVSPKWLLEDPAREPATGKASAVLESVVCGRLEILLPLYRLAAVAAVAACIAPRSAAGDVEMLAALRFPATDGPNVMRRATSQSIRTGDHFFHTPYHAVALEHDDALPLTADARYCLKAERCGTAVALRSWGDGV